MPSTASMERILFAAWERIHPRIEKLGVGHVLPAERAFAAVWLLEAEVNNGGFAQYMFNSTADEAPFARDALAAIGATATLRVFDELLALLPNGQMAATQEARHSQLDVLAVQYGEEQFDEMLSTLDERFYATEVDLRERLFAFVTTKLSE